ncbi:MAG: site-specific DNA-methyltransferase [Chloroflexi bacterium]|nr:site-specific DNA-methyltransferase [Chloroflexota bacterium]
MNQIFFGDNLPILKSLPDESVDLIYIDPPFNTGKVQKLTQVKTLQSEDGDRVGFQGKKYETVALGTKAYKDSFSGEDDEALSRYAAYQDLSPEASIYFLESFLRPRLEEAHRLLKPHGSLYFHIDYREAHYCKILLDSVFGRKSYLNEIIWAYDFGGRSKSKWPAKHDTIFFYAKNPKAYIFNTNEIDREPYMAPGLVGKEKAQKGKLPTDTWFYSYVGRKPTDTWWQTIVPTNSKERVGYPTQKPTKLLERILRASSHPNSIVLDFFAGSGSMGEACLKMKRNFILMDSNQEALEVMAKRFSGIKDIEWMNFDPGAFQREENQYIIEKLKSGINTPELSENFRKLASSASVLENKFKSQDVPWENSPFEWQHYLAPNQKEVVGKELMLSWLESEEIMLKKEKVSLKFSTLSAEGNYEFENILEDDHEYLLCFGISPFEAHAWVFERATLSTHAKENLISINPKNTPDWLKGKESSLESAIQILRKTEGIIKH